MAGDADPGIVSQHAFQSRFFIAGAIGDDHHTRVQGVTDAHPATVMKTHPTCTRDGVEGKVEEGPVGNSITAVEHALRFTVGRSDTTAIQMIAADDNRRRNLTRFYKAVHNKTHLNPLVIPEPAYSCG